MEEESANHSTVPEEPEINLSTTILNDKELNEKSTIEIHGMGDLDDEKITLSVPEEPEINPSTTILNDKELNEKSTTEIRGLEDPDDEKTSLSVPEEPVINPSTTILNDKLLIEKSTTEIRGMEDPDDEKTSLSEMQLVQRKTTANRLSSMVSEWGKKSTVKTSTEKSGSIGESAERDGDRSSLHSAAEDLKSGETLPRTSIVRFSKRSSIRYDPSSRIDTEEEDLGSFFDLKQNEIVLFDDYDEIVEEESEVHTIEEEGSILDRDLYYRKYDETSEQLIKNKIKNNVLQKLVAMYLKRRRIDYGGKDPHSDHVTRYGQKLNAYQQLMEIDMNQRLTVERELFELLTKRNSKLLELDNLFKNLQSREENVGHGLIYFKTGIELSEKTIQRSLKRQANQFHQVCHMRLQYIKLKEMVNEKITAINKVDIIGDNLHLSDYEQLKEENRCLADKIEEREEELTLLRSKGRKTTQVLAHMREKIAALSADEFDLKESLKAANTNMTQCRTRVSSLKQEKENYRKMSNKLKDESGLLTKPQLLIDMEKTQKEVKTAETELIKYKSCAIKKTTNVKKLRHKMRIFTEEINEEQSLLGLKDDIKDTEVIKKDPRSFLFQSSKSTASVYKKRPSLNIPTIKSNVFDHVLKIRPTPVVRDKRK